MRYACPAYSFSSVAPSTLEPGHLQRLDPAHVHVRRAAGRAVLDDVAAARDGARLVRVERHLERHVGDARLRQVLVAEQRLLVVGLRPLATRAWSGTRSARWCCRRSSRRARPSRRPRPRPPRPAVPRRRRGSRARRVRNGAPTPRTPERVRQHREQHGRRRSSRRGTTGAKRAEVALPVHVGQRRRRPAGVLVQVVLEARGDRA